jgi:hypothetical protein
MSDLPSDVLVQKRETLIDAAVAVLAEHLPDEHGLCAGCMHAWGRWVPHAGCTQVQWARSAIETHGVAAWDVSDKAPARSSIVADANQRAQATRREAPIGPLARSRGCGFGEVTRPAPQMSPDDPGRKNGEVQHVDDE